MREPIPQRPRVKDDGKLRILAIDPATKCGWAHSAGDSGVWDLSVRKDESGGMRLIRFRGKLTEVRASVGVDLVVFEASRNMKYGNAVRVAAQLKAIIEEWCEDREIAYRAYSATEVKKHATGKGNAGKPEMMAAAERRGWEVEDDNHADALWILELAKRDYAAVTV